ncbi:MAG: hypothetical protein U0R24_00145 [Solirubrobacterales bacterium]
MEVAVDVEVGGDVVGLDRGGGAAVDLADLGDLLLGDPAAAAAAIIGSMVSRRR